jgi:hypothetical protein
MLRIAGLYPVYDPYTLLNLYLAARYSRQDEPMVSISGEGRPSNGR